MGFWDRIGQRIGELVDDIDVGAPTRELLDRAKEAHDGGDFSLTEQLLDRYTQDVPDRQPAWLLLGSAQLEQGKWRDARSSLERSLTLCESDAHTLTLLARAQWQLGEVEGALVSSKRALDTGVAEKALAAEIYALRGEMLLEGGDADRAVRELRKAVAAANGRDLRLVGLLGCALWLDGNARLASHHLQTAATSPEVEPAVLETLVSVLLEGGQTTDAERAARRLLELKDSLSGRLALARVHLAQREPEKARDTLLRALELDRSNWEVHHLLARAQLLVNDAPQALEHLRAAYRLRGERDIALTREMLAVLLDSLPAHPDRMFGGLRGELKQLGEALLAGDAHDSEGLAATALAKIDDLNTAMGEVAQALAGGETYTARLALALLFDHGDQLDAAINAYQAALTIRPRAAFARLRLTNAYRRRLHTDPGGENDLRGAPGLYSTFHLAERVLRAHPFLADLTGEISRIRQDFDRPLLLAVMGEFNAGKSTFVNALVGERVAPMGITPTTATINVLKYGEERAARVIWRDDREELLSWEDLESFLHDLDDERARAVRVVELLYPAEELTRVNIVDTPGLNSIVEEHEHTAREFLEQADAIIWLFSADQAGKQSEERALAVMQELRLKTVGALNKVDRLDEAQLAQVLDHMEQGFSELVEHILPVSSKLALEARVAQDDEAFARSRFGELRAHLEVEIFARSRRIKKQVAAQRLEAIIARGLERLEEQRRPLATLRERLDDVRSALAAMDPKVFTDAERRALHLALSDIYRAAAHEVLEFVQPRRGAFFGKNRAERADRDFLLELMVEQLDRLGSHSKERVLGRIHLALGSGLAALERVGPTAHLEISAGGNSLQQRLASSMDVLDHQVYGHFLSFARGTLHGGRIDHFFDEQLPTASLDEASLVALLDVDAPRFEVELSDALLRWVSDLRIALNHEIEALEARATIAELELEVSTTEPLRRIVERNLLAGAESTPATRRQSSLTARG
ncbi:MAG: dynamin family protein [Deltaproteobacteria bacterium]|nr:dynamin family protein [Deltaproteobacteria bacterium]